MEFNKKRAQGLPLNTIVIAVLVVVVLVVIVLAFTTNIGNFNDSVEDTGASQCTADNPAIVTIYGSGADVQSSEPESDAEDARQVCPEGLSRVPGISGDSEGTFCCATN